MPDIISTDHPLTKRQRSLLAALLDTLVPASEDGEMPSAAEVGFDEYLQTQAEDLIPELVETLQRLQTLEPEFPDLPLPERCERVSAISTQDPAQFQNLLARVYDCYYQNDQVRRQIGVATGAPFPQGNEVLPGDLSLLDPVIENSARHRYRKQSEPVAPTPR